MFDEHTRGESGRESTESRFAESDFAPVQPQRVQIVPHLESMAQVIVRLFSPFMTLVSGISTYSWDFDVSWNPIALTRCMPEAITE